jgi:hypothetical protein
MYLQGSVEDKMNGIVEEIMENRQDWNNEDPEQVFDGYFEEMFNSHGEWWDFDLSDLTLLNFNQLLESFENMRQEMGEPANEGLSVRYLVSLYGLWYGMSLKEKYVNILKDALEQTEENSDDE